MSQLLEIPPAPRVEAEDYQRPIGRIEHLWNFAILRRVLLLAMVALGWEFYARWLGRPLVVPTFLNTAWAFYDSLLHGDLPARTWTSLVMLGIGYGSGVLAAAALTIMAAIIPRVGSDLLETLASLFNPLPAIALLPLALLWFGVGTPSMIFVMAFAVVWPVAQSTAAGFAGVGDTLRMVGRSYGLSPARFVVQLLIPAAFPSILNGLKVGWAFAWRTLIAAELVFGVSSGSGGLGWFIYENKNQLETARVFAGLGTVMLIGVAFESLVFRTIEKHTLRKWGMRR
jgi:NitT/TauT family transport system permease protein